MAKEPEEPTTEEATDDGKRLDQLEARQESLSGKLDQVISMLSGRKPEGAEPGAGPPADIASEIRQQLDARDAKEKADRAAAERDGTLASLQATVKELAEKAPAPVPRRVERLMGWTE